MYKLGTTNLLQTTNATLVTSMTTQLYKLGTKQLVNLGHLIFQVMVNHVEFDLFAYVPYLCLISKLLQRKKVKVLLKEKESIQVVDVLYYRKKLERLEKVDNLG